MHIAKIHQFVCLSPSISIEKSSNISLNSMDLEPIEFLTNYSYFPGAESYIQSHEFAEYSHGNSSCYSHSENNSSRNSLQEGSFLEYGDQDLIFLEEALEFDPTNDNPDFLSTSTDQNPAEMDSWIQPNEKDDSFFEGIQAELMEEESLTDLLLAAAEAVEAQNQPLASNLIEKLKNLLLCDSGSSPFNRLAWFFTQGLHSKTTFANIEPPREMADQENKNSISAFQMLQQLSPYIKFAHFTANQAILEAAQGEEALHVMDFDIMEGIQWPPLMADLVAKKDFCSLRLTAVVQDHENEAKIEQTGRRLSEFAKSINFPFEFDHVRIEKAENFGKIQVGQALIANCSGMLHHILSHSNTSKLETFLSGVAKLSPKCVVLVEEELFKVSKAQPMSFVEFFFEAFHHFSALSDSLLRCFCGAYESGFRQVEEFLGARILESVRQFPCDDHNNNYLLRNGIDQHLKGYKKIPFTSLNCCQAKYLVSLFRGDFWVQHEKCRLSLCWKSRPLCTATIWVPRVKGVEQ